MKFLFSILIILSLLEPAFANKSPFDIEMSLNDNLLIVSVSSKQGSNRYKMIMDLKGSGIKINNINEVFTGTSEVDVKKEHNLPITNIKEGGGEISAKIYLSTDSMELDADSVKEVYVSYDIGKDENGEYKIKLGALKERTIKQGEGTITVLDMKEVASSSDNINVESEDSYNAQKFVINKQKRFNTTARGLLLVLSFFILAYLCYRILSKKNGL